MILIIYDVAHHGPRQKLERLLRDACFVFLFRNARWTDRRVDKSGLARRILITLRGESFRVLIADIPRRSRTTARWLHRSAQVNSK